MIDINNFTKKVDELIFYLDDIGGKKLLKEITKEEEKLIQNDPELEGAFNALQFLLIPFKRTNKIADLINKKLYVGLSLEELDIKERIGKKLLFLDLADRDNCKKSLKESLVSNTERITDSVTGENKKTLKNVIDWIKDYISYTGIKGGRSLQKAQYFQKAYFTKLDKDEKEMVKKLFDLYDFLNISSFTPEGFEDDLLIKTEDGRMVTTNKGQVVTLYDPKKFKSKQITVPKARIVDIPKSSEEKSIEELKEMIEQYPGGSLERKAIEEEMEKLNR